MRYARLMVGALTRLDGRGWLHETAGEGRWIYDCAREEYTLDRNCARLLRLPGSVGLRLPRQTIRDMLGPDAARFFSSRFSRLMNARDHDGSFVERVLLHLPDGSRKNFLVSGTLVGHDGSGQPVFVTGNLVQRGGEEPLEALSSKSCEISLMALFGSGDGLWDVRIFRCGEILFIYVNDEVVLSTRAYDFQEGLMGAYVVSGKIDIERFDCLAQKR